MDQKEDRKRRNLDGERAERRLCIRIRRPTAFRRPLHQALSSPLCLFYQQTFRNEASLHLSSWSFREPADNQHKSRRALQSTWCGTGLLSHGSHSWLHLKIAFVANDDTSSRDWFDHRFCRALRAHIRIFKTTSESGLTTAENSDVVKSPPSPLPSK